VASSKGSLWGVTDRAVVVHTITYLVIALALPALGLLLTAPA